MLVPIVGAVLIGMGAMSMLKGSKAEEPKAPDGKNDGTDDDNDGPDLAKENVELRVKLANFEGQLTGIGKKGSA